MAILSVQELGKTYSEVTALDSVSFEFNEGILSVLGPSGCGKTTLLRSIAGLEVPDAGRIMIHDKVQTWISKGIHVPPYARAIGFVFQNYALWPHMTVFKNVAFGLKLKHLSIDEIRRRVRSALELVGLEQHESRYPSQLSGGQQQRVALARSVVLEPKLILLDEPLSNLDAKLREEMRVELRKLIKRIGISALYVTHDQEEAFTISDSVIVMNRGKIVQYAKPEDIYNRPATEFVASFVGHSFLVDGKLLKVGPEDCLVAIPDFDGAALVCPYSGDLASGASCKLVIRTSEIRLSSLKLDQEDNVIEGTMLSREDRGGFTDHRILVGAREIVVTSHRRCPLISVDAGGEKIFLHIDKASMSLIPNHGEPTSSNAT